MALLGSQAPHRPTTTGSHMFKSQDFRVRGSNPRVIPCPNLKSPFESSELPRGLAHLLQTELLKTGLSDFAQNAQEPEPPKPEKKAATDSDSDDDTENAPEGSCLSSSSWSEYGRMSMQSMSAWTI